MYGFLCSKCSKDITLLYGYMAYTFSCHVYYDLTCINKLLQIKKTVSYRIKKNSKKTDTLYAYKALLEFFIK